MGNFDFYNDAVYITREAMQELKHILYTNFVQPNMKIFQRCAYWYRWLNLNLNYLIRNFQKSLENQSIHGYGTYILDKVGGYDLGEVKYRIYKNSNYYNKNKYILAFESFSFNVSQFGMLENKERKIRLYENTLIKDIIVNYITECVIRRLKEM